MIGKRKLILDTHSEVYRKLLPWINGEFWDLGIHEIQTNSIYLLGCKQMVE